MIHNVSGMYLYMLYVPVLVSESVCCEYRVGSCELVCVSTVVIVLFVIK